MTKFFNRLSALVTQPIASNFVEQQKRLLLAKQYFLPIALNQPSTLLKFGGNHEENSLQGYAGLYAENIVFCRVPILRIFDQDQNVEGMAGWHLPGNFQKEKYFGGVNSRDFFGEDFFRTVEKSLEQNPNAKFQLCIHGNDYKNPLSKGFDDMPICWSEDFKNVAEAEIIIKEAADEASKEFKVPIPLQELALGPAGSCCDFYATSKSVGINQPPQDFSIPNQSQLSEEVQYC